MSFSYQQELLRKSVHLSSLWMVLAVCFLPRIFLLFLFGVLLILNICIEYGYYKNQPFCQTVYGKLFGKMLREKETDGKFHLSGSPYVLGAAFTVTFLFPKEAAATALTVMFLGDTAAALFGRKYGKHKINDGKKSVEGSLAFFSVSLAVLYFFSIVYDFPALVWMAGIGGIFLATLAEVYEDKLRIDDNLSVPLCVGFALSAML